MPLPSRCFAPSLLAAALCAAGLGSMRAAGVSSRCDHDLRPTASRSIDGETRFDVGSTTIKARVAPA